MDEITITINEKKITTLKGKTILQVIRENKLDDIPTLCHDDRIEPYGSCFVCVVEVEGLNKLVPSCSTPVNEGMRIITNNDKIRNARKSALELLLSNHYADCIGPCSNNCPAGVDVQGYIALISMHKYEDALNLIRKANPLPLSIGRVCVRNCEDACRRCNVDEPVAINFLKRYVADMKSIANYELRITNERLDNIHNERGDSSATLRMTKKNVVESFNPTTDKLRKSAKKVAVIGAGPAGLTTAYYLTLKGYSVTIFEKMPELGGMLRYGIPEYRLPKEILDLEIQWILCHGIEVITGIEMGKDFSIAELKKQGYDAIFLGVGAWKATSMGLENEEHIRGIYKGIDFLREVVCNGDSNLKGTVAIVGGGNTAIDAARTALRCGAENVKIVYRRSIKEMPAHPSEIAAAQEEGVDIQFLTNPKSIISKNGKLKGIECFRMKLEEGKPGERPRPVVIPGSEFVVECDYLISAIGQQVDPAFVDNGNSTNSQKMDGKEELKFEKWGTISINKINMETSIPGVYAGGDVVNGPLTAVAAIGQGRKAANAIDIYLKNKDNNKLKLRTYYSAQDDTTNGKFYSFKHRFGDLPESEFKDIEKYDRAKMPELTLKERNNNFREVELGLTESQAACEALRCLECGCSEYYDCKLRKYADEFNIDITNYLGDVRKYKVDKRHPFIILDPNKCIDCGKCVRTCSEILNVSALGFVYRGFKSIVKPAMEKALLETNCISCGNCIDVCPTGAICEKYPFKVPGTLPKSNHSSVCNFCSLGCNVNFKVIETVDSSTSHRITSVKEEGDDIFYVSNSTEEIINTINEGYLCSKGRFGYRYLMEKNRIEDAAIRIKSLFLRRADLLMTNYELRNTNYRTSDLEPGVTSEKKKEYNDISSGFTKVGINEAIDYAAKKLKNIIKNYGNDSIAVFASPKLTNEELYLIQKFARAGLKTNNVWSFGSMIYDMGTESTDDMPVPIVSTTRIEDLNKADVIVVMNADLTEEQLILELKVKKAQKTGAKLILISSMESELSKHADLWLDTRKGTNTILLNGLINELRITKYELRNKSNIESHTHLFPFSNGDKESYVVDKELVIELTGINNEKYEQFINQLKDENSNIIFIYNLDSFKEKSRDDLKAIINFLSMTKRTGKDNNGVIILREHSNSTGLNDMGVNPKYLPGYVRSNEKEEINRLSELWNTELHNIFKPIALQREMLEEKIKAVLIFGEDPLEKSENIKYFNGVEFMLVMDAFETDTSKEADVIIPAGRSIEQHGTYTTCDTKIQEVEPVIKKRNDLENWEIFCRLGRKFSSGFSMKTYYELWCELRNVNRFYRYCVVGDYWNKKAKQELFKTITNYELRITNYRLNNLHYDKELELSPQLIDMRTYYPDKHSYLYSEKFVVKNIKNKLLKSPLS